MTEQSFFERWQFDEVVVRSGLQEGLLRTVVDKITSNCLCVYGKVLGYDTIRDQALQMIPTEKRSICRSLVDTLLRSKLGGCKEDFRPVHHRTKRNKNIRREGQLSLL